MAASTPTFPHVRDAVLPEYPPFMTTALAARYTGFANARGLLSAYRRGRVRPWGRRGGTGAFVWRRDDLDAFMRGVAPDDSAAGAFATISTQHASPPMPPARALGGARAADDFDQ
jgi:hypothetical protein